MRPHDFSLRTDLELRRLASEVSQLRTELSEKPKAGIVSIFSNPTWLVVLGAVVSITTGFWQLQANRQLEREKLRSSLIQEASKSGNPETTLKNLKFLVKAGLVEDEKNVIANLSLDGVPSFQSSPITPLTRMEMLEVFGDPKLRKSSTNDIFTDFAIPDDAWVSENLVEIELPELVGVPGFPKSGKIKFHKKAAPHLQAAIKELHQKGLIKKILSFDGAWLPRTVRGNSEVYSIHTFGIALDLNSRFNIFGRLPPPADQEGSIVDLVPIFEKHGFYWGGRFQRQEGAHFQYGLKSSTIKMQTGAEDFE